MEDARQKIYSDYVKYGTCPGYGNQFLKTFPEDWEKLT